VMLAARCADAAFGDGADVVRHRGTYPDVSSMVRRTPGRARAIYRCRRRRIRWEDVDPTSHVINWEDKRSNCRPGVSARARERTGSASRRGVAEAPRALISLDAGERAAE